MEYTRSQQSVSVRAPFLSWQLPTLPPVLVRDYELTLWRGEEAVLRLAVRDNAKRLTTHRTNADADRLTVTVRRTYGADFAAIFGISVYGKGE